MKSLLLRVAGVSVLLAACEKPTPFEITTPAGAGSSSAPTFDASLPLLDASSLSSGDGALGDGALAEETPVGEFTQAGLLSALGSCALDRYRSFAALARDLRDATLRNRDAPSPENLSAVQDLWRQADRSWQELELFRFGPAGSSGLPGGKDLRNNIYYYPDLNNCQVDQILVSGAYSMGASVLSVSGKGLGALEYLLFYAGDQNSCLASTAINTPPSAGASSPWAAIEASERARRRADYAAVISEDLVVQANALVVAWDPGQGGFLTQFASAGAGSTLFARAYDAFNVVDDAMWYLDVEVKDYKLAIPAGISPVCVPGPCPEAVESRYALMANENLRANIAGFRLLFNGCGTNFSGLGFDDWLRTIGRADLADEMTRAAIAADQAVVAMPLPLEQMLSADLGKVQAVYTAVQALTNLFKADFTTALNLQRPAVNEGDND